MNAMNEIIAEMRLAGADAAQACTEPTEWTGVYPLDGDVEYITETLGVDLAFATQDDWTAMQDAWMAGYIERSETGGSHES